MDQSNWYDQRPVKWHMWDEDFDDHQAALDKTCAKSFEPYSRGDLEFVSCNELFIERGFWSNTGRYCAHG